MDAKSPSLDEVRARIDADRRRAAAPGRRARRPGARAWPPPRPRPATATSFGLRPAREAQLLRRLLAAPAPAARPPLIVRIWRELIGDSLARRARSTSPSGAAAIPAAPSSWPACASAPPRRCARSPSPRTPWPPATHPRRRRRLRADARQRLVGPAAGRAEAEGVRRPALPRRLGPAVAPWPWPRSRSSRPATTAPSGSPTRRRAPAAIEEALSRDGVAADPAGRGRRPEAVHPGRLLPGRRRAPGPRARPAFRRDRGCAGAAGRVRGGPPPAPGSIPPRSRCPDPPPPTAPRAAPAPQAGHPGHPRLCAGQGQGRGHRRPGQAVGQREHPGLQPARRAAAYRRGRRRACTSIRTAAPAIAARRHRRALSPGARAADLRLRLRRGLRAAQPDLPRARRQHRPGPVRLRRLRHRRRACQAEVRFAPRAQLPHRRRRDAEAASTTARGSSSSPTPATPPAPGSRSPRSAACTRRLPPSVVLVLDGAYGEFATDPQLRRRPGPGARRSTTSWSPTPSPSCTAWRRCAIGWGYAPAEIAEAVDRIRLPFNTSIAGPARRRGGPGRRGLPARARWSWSSSWRPWLTQQLGGLGLEVVALGGQLRPGAASRKTPGRTAAEAEAFLASRGLIWCAASPTTACPTTCASPSAWRSTTAPWSTRWPTSWSDPSR